MKAMTSVALALLFWPVQLSRAQSGSGTPKRDYPVKPVAFTAVHFNDALVPRQERRRRWAMTYNGFTDPNRS